MPQSEMQNQKIKEDIKTAWNKGDANGLLRAGLDSFVNLIVRSEPIPFQKFLDYTSESFDRFILETEQKDHLSYVGGKMVLELEKNTAVTPAIIYITADFYFQTTDEKWVMQTKKGKIECSHFSDWDTAPGDNTKKLKETGKLEMSIEPPQIGTK